VSAICILGCIGNSLEVLLPEHSLEPANLRGNVGSGEPGYLRHRFSRLAFKVKQDNLAIQGLQLADQIQKHCG
jgi:hypothetical protein